MDELGTGLSLVPLAGVLAVIVGLTVLSIQKVKQLVCTHWKGAWTQRIPKWVWIVASVAIPAVLIFLVSQSWAQDWINFYLPPDWHIHLSADDMLPTVLSSAVGSNGSYAVAKKYGLVGDYTPGGPNDVTPQPVVLEAPIVPEPVVVPEPVYVPQHLAPPKATLLQEVMVTPGAKGGPLYVWLDDDTGHRVIPVRSD
jgi:hypothetical protein